MPRILLVALVSALIATGLAAFAPAGPAAAYDRNCSDFATQAAAQRFYLSQGGPQRDPHRLDADSDGIACETLPCPCDHSRTPTGGAPTPQTAPKPRPTFEKARVTRIVDGDTLAARLRNGRGRTVTVRLIGIDTPEVHGGVECGGPEASRALSRLLPVGRRITLVSDRSQQRTDRYGRALRYVQKGRKDVNRLLIRRGHARVYVYNNTPFRRVAAYRRAERQARSADRGIWGRC